MVKLLVPVTPPSPNTSKTITARSWVKSEEIMERITKRAAPLSCDLTPSKRNRISLYPPPNEGQTLAQYAELLPEKKPAFLVPFDIDAETLMTQFAEMKILLHRLEEKEVVTEQNNQKLQKQINALQSNNLHIYQANLITKILRRLHAQHPAEGTGSQSDLYDGNRLGNLAGSLTDKRMKDWGIPSKFMGILEGYDKVSNCGTHEEDKN